jgi:hypothetical protein
MLLDRWVPIATETTLLVVVAVLAASIAASLAIPERKAS